jgi:hypothetical protein
MTFQTPPAANMSSPTHSERSSAIVDIEKNSAKADTTTEPAPPSGQPPSSPPEGGRRAWLTVAGGAAGMFTSFGFCNCIGLFQAYYEENQLRSYSSSEVAWITSMQCECCAYNPRPQCQSHIVRLLPSCIYTTGRQALRQLRTDYPTGNRLIYARLWSDDDQPVHEILSVSAEPIHLLWDRHVADILRFCDFGMAEEHQISWCP